MEYLDIKSYFSGDTADRIIELRAAIDRAKGDVDEQNFLRHVKENLERIIAYNRRIMKLENDIELMEARNDERLVKLFFSFLLNIILIIVVVALL